MRHHRLPLLAAAACLLAACGPLRYNSAPATSANNPATQASLHLPGNDASSQHGIVNTSADNSISYIVDGQQYTGEATTEEDLTTLYLKILGLAKLGHNVSITAKGDDPAAKKTDVHTFSAENEADVAVWATRMVRKGYSVTVVYDKSTHIYNCTAYKRKK